MRHIGFICRYFQQESDSSLSLSNVPELPAPQVQEIPREKGETKSDKGHKRSNNILTKMFDFRFATYCIYHDL